MCPSPLMASLSSRVRRQVRQPVADLERLAVSDGCERRQGLFPKLASLRYPPLGGFHLRQAIAGQRWLQARFLGRYRQDLFKGGGRRLELSALQGQCTPLVEGPAQERRQVHRPDQLQPLLQVLLGQGILPTR